MKREARIYCPKCSYKPWAEDRWSCLPACGTWWHTFWTAGVCPGCGCQWAHTQCPACDQVSLHKAWYHWPDDERSTSEASDAQHQRQPAVTSHD